MTDRRRRRGFAMITTLWIMTVASVVAAAALLSGRDTMNAARNRVGLERAYWLARGCAARAHAGIDARLRDAPSLDATAATWRVLDRSVLPVAAADECEVRLEAAGARLDVNETSEEMLANLFLAMGLGAGAPELASAIVQARPLASLRALAHVRGFEHLALDSVLTIEPGRVSLANASVAVLLSVPGITREAAERFVELRYAGAPAPDVTAILGDISRGSAETLVANYPAIIRATTANPEAWLLVVRARVGSPSNTVTLVRRLVRMGRRAEVVATRSEL